MADLVCPYCKKDLLGYAGEVKAVPDFDEAVMSYSYKNVGADLDADMPYFPEDFFDDNPPDIISYFPNISVEITCPYCGEPFSVQLKEEDIEDLKSQDRGVGGSAPQDIFSKGKLKGKPGQYYFEELHLESGEGEYRGKKVFNFTDIRSVSDLKETMERAAQEGYIWFESPEKPEFSGILYGSLKESLIDKEEIKAYVNDAYYLARNKRFKACFELLKTARENITHIGRREVEEALRPESLKSFIRKYFREDKGGYGKRIDKLFTDARG